MKLQLLLFLLATITGLYAQKKTETYDALKSFYPEEYLANSNTIERENQKLVRHSKLSPELLYLYFESLKEKSRLGYKYRISNFTTLYKHKLYQSKKLRNQMMYEAKNYVTIYIENEENRETIIGHINNQVYSDNLGFGHDYKSLYKIKTNTKLDTNLINYFAVSYLNGSFKERYSQDFDYEKELSKKLNEKKTFYINQLETVFLLTKLQIEALIVRALDDALLFNNSYEPKVQIVPISLHEYLYKIMSAWKKSKLFSREKKRYNVHDSNISFGAVFFHAGDETHPVMSVSNPFIQTSRSLDISYTPTRILAGYKITLNSEWFYLSYIDIKAGVSWIKISPITDFKTERYTYFDLNQYYISGKLEYYDFQVHPKPNYQIQVMLPVLRLFNNLYVEAGGIYNQYSYKGSYKSRFIDGIYEAYDPDVEDDLKYLEPQHTFFDYQYKKYDFRVELKYVLYNNFMFQIGNNPYGGVDFGLVFLTGF
jgi:hypothetical protein